MQGVKGGPEEEVKERSRTERGRRDPYQIDFNLGGAPMNYSVGRGAPLSILSGSSGDQSCPRTFFLPLGTLVDRRVYQQ